MATSNHNRRELIAEAFPGLNLAAIDTALPPNTPVRLENMEASPDGGLSTIPGRVTHAALDAENPVLLLATYTDGNGVEWLVGVANRSLYRIDTSSGDETALFTW